MNCVDIPWGREGRERSPSEVMNSVTDTEDTLEGTWRKERINSSVLKNMLQFVFL